MRQALDGGATDVHRHSPAPQRDEVPLLSGRGVEQAHIHVFQTTDTLVNPVRRPGSVSSKTTGPDGAMLGA
ncbi:hypothetical protein PA7_12700 [Pseudonocardia asaccharolytica DSM 44247 = NBRC 16224]|uniref:Uncharacterized protein n=1 Tax=Pseudonocardia asaccharolytica DSM 44247 = NBRC 16224 TaxID=1123024 RepID=A0A511CYU4_9PSEU|nr:hypothetical protein PA7_12700 [Pseudonocardia asaccharolytica DSM 44247 = NBRC 16224]